MEVRPASVADARRIAEIHVRSWQSGYRGLMPQGFLDGLDPAQRLDYRIKWLTETDWARGACLVVIADDGQLAGFADIGSSRDTDGDTAGAGEVRAIYLAPDAWGKGLGRELMAASLGQLADRGYQQVTLWVLDSNARARRFYEAAGFSPDGGVKVDVTRGFPLTELRYRRPLP